MTRRVPAAMAFVALSVLAIACSDDDPSADPPTTTESTVSIAPESTAAVTTEPPTTTSTTATTTAAPTTPPPTAGPTTAPPIAEDDWIAILNELSRRQVALYAAPDLTRIGEYCMPATDCAASLEAQLGDFIARGEHVEGQKPFEIVEIIQVSVGEPSPAGTIAQLVFVVAPTSPPPARIVDAAGNVVDELSLTTTPTRGVFTLAKWDDPLLPWRLVLAEDLGPA